MKVKEVIKNLGHLDPEAEIVHAWWDKDCFPDVPQEDWNWAVDVVDSKMDWSNAHTDIEVTMQYVLESEQAGYIDKGLKDNDKV
jgi:hypothetical protein